MKNRRKHYKLEKHSVVIPYKIHIVEMFVLLKAIYWLSRISIKIPSLPEEELQAATRYWMKENNVFFSVVLPLVNCLHSARCRLLQESVTISVRHLITSTNMERGLAWEEEMRDWYDLIHYIHKAKFWYDSTLRPTFSSWRYDRRLSFCAHSSLSLSASLSIRC